MIKDDIFSGTSIVHSDAFGRFLWVRIDRKHHCQRDFFLAVCYFLLAISHYASHGTENGERFVDLSEIVSFCCFRGHHHSRGFQCEDQRTLDSALRS